MVDIMAYSNYCGPAAVASLLGISKERAAGALKIHKQPYQKRIRATTYLDQISELLKTINFKHRIVDLSKRGKYGDRFPLHFWLATDLKDKLALVRVKTSRGGHLLLVCDGEVKEDNNVDSMRYAVTHWIEIERG
jgi:hypothetical protein